MNEKMTIEDLAVKIDNLTGTTKKSIEDLKETMDKGFEDMAIMIQNTMASKELVTELVGDVMEHVDNIEQNVRDIKATLPTALDHIRLETRVETLEENMEKVKPKVSLA